jgi:ribosome-binding factor A
VYFSVLKGDPDASASRFEPGRRFLAQWFVQAFAHPHCAHACISFLTAPPERASDMNALIAKAVASRAKDD